MQVWYFRQKALLLLPPFHSAIVNMSFYEIHTYQASSTTASKSNSSSVINVIWMSTFKFRSVITNEMLSIDFTRSSWLKHSKMSARQSSSTKGFEKIFSQESPVNSSKKNSPRRICKRVFRL